MKKILTIFGTRPEAIKMAPILHAFEKENINSIVCVTGQHREMLDQMMSIFGFNADVDLNLMSKNQNLPSLVSLAVKRTAEVIDGIDPDIILVHGDTSSTFSAALAGFYARVPIAHVEAGLRTGTYASPFPEEMNRTFVDSVSTLFFAPTESNRKNLLEEGYDDEKIFVTGNTVIDALFYVREKLKKDLEFKNFFSKSFPILGKGDRRVLVTVHRRENYEMLKGICLALKQISKEKGIQIVLPVHPNPNVKDVVYDILSGVDGICLISPLDYPSMVQMMETSSLILTDSGGVQEEAPSLDKPVLVLRETTERPEAVDTGAVRVIGTNTNNIVKEVNHVLGDTVLYSSMCDARNPYGDGKAALKIVRHVMDFLSR